MHKLPLVANKLCYCFDAWVVGGAANSATPITEVRDFDILVPLSRWQEAASLIPIDAKPNSFGGWKFVSEGKEVDVWPGELSFILKGALCRYAWHPATNSRWERTNAV